MLLDRSESLGPLAAVLALLILPMVPDRGAPGAATPIPEAVLELASPGNETSWPLAAGPAIVTPSDVFRLADAWCRTYRLALPEEQAAVEATACREAPGTWRPQAAALVAELPAD